MIKMKQINVGLITIKRMMILLQVWQYIQIIHLKEHFQEIDNTLVK